MQKKYLVKLQVNYSIKFRLEYKSDIYKDKDTFTSQNKITIREKIKDTSCTQ